jgi:hypothetical protein
LVLVLRTFLRGTTFRMKNGSSLRNMIWQEVYYYKYLTRFALVRVRSSYCYILSPITSYISKVAGSLLIGETTPS